MFLEDPCLEALAPNQTERHCWLRNVFVWALFVAVSADFAVRLRQPARRSFLDCSAGVRLLNLYSSRQRKCPSRLSIPNLEDAAISALPRYSLRLGNMH